MATHRRLLRVLTLGFTCVLPAIGAGAPGGSPATVTPVLAAPSGAQAPTPEARPTGSPTTPAPRRVLVYTVSAGYEHDVVRRPAPEESSLVERELVSIGRASGAFEAVPRRDAAAFEAESLATFDAVLFYTTGTLPLSDAQRTAFLAFVRGGGGFVGVHCATDTFDAWPEYGDLVGARFDGHPWHENVRVRVERPTHPAMVGLGATFEIVDEIYQFRAPYDRDRLRVLMSLDVSAVDTKREGVHRADRDFALAWTKPFGAGRVFYTALGHRPEVWADARFRTHLVGGIRWAMRDEPRTPFAERDEMLRASASTSPGDPRKGHEVFRRESGPMCIRCHRVNEAGGVVGPDLSGVALRLAREELVDAVLAPSAAIEPGYESVVLELADGTSAFGRIVKEADGRIELADTNGQTRAIDARHVVGRSTSRLSAMPDGLAGTLSEEEFRDLVAYLATLRMPAVR